MISKYLSSIEGISVYPVIGLILFFGLFLFFILWIVRLDKNYLTHMGNLPFENKNEINNKIENKDETKK